MMKNNKPVIRFKGFSEEWNEKELGEIATMKARIGWQGLTQKEFLDCGDYYLITGTDFNNGSIDIKNCHYIGADRYNQDSNIQIKDNDVLITKDGTIGKVAFVKNLDKPATLNAGVFVVRGKNENISNLYLYHHLASPLLLDFADKQATGGTIKHLNQNVLVRFPVPLPQFQEQTQIGNFFKNLDNLITLHQRKYEKLGVLKKAMLEKMFPKKGANVPEIRFKGFEGAWEERTLGEMCVIGDIDHRMPESVKDGIPYIMTGSFVGINDIDFENSKLISIEDYEQLSKKIKPELGDILFARYASVGAVRYVEAQKNFLVSYSCAILKSNSTFSSKYLFYYLQSNETQRQIELEINTGSQRNIGIDSLKKLIIFLPQDKEQEKIGTYFKNLDDLLRLHEKELEKLKNLKKALLEKMFV
ncbi:restriction endonuclease subunit S [Cellulophaga sp. BC115SP]|uniref:restriction endonuclease subunit S n=1 Tax=Cellulophaga sp. BC115SP TaxID=2683263 RepID=UPI00141374FE|nr:restriction endonuclease subunit S [Cellulophaga sp. BC115SP]NBB28012.1 restriction endonuclease subunit S [Cellulophaga sp. BC115SP]